MATTKSDALHSLKPGAEWALAGDTLTWLDSKQTKPTDSEITAEITRLDSVYANEKYKRDRKPLYPEIGDQLDDLYKQGVFSADMASKIKKVKDDNPKP